VFNQWVEDGDVGKEVASACANHTRSAGSNKRAENVLECSTVSTANAQVFTHISMRNKNVGASVDECRVATALKVELAFVAEALGRGQSR
jgi:hypothetical protein